MDALEAALLEARPQAASWSPSDQGGLFRRADAAAADVIAPSHVIDDGNLVIAILDCTVPDSTESKSKEVARSVDKTGRVLQGAILDAGLHRLLVVVVRVEPGSGAQIESYLEARGELRVLLTSHDEDATTFARRLAPLERIEPFLEKVAEEEDASAVSIVLENVDDALGPLRDAVVADIQALLGGAPISDVAWEGSVRELDRLAKKHEASNREGTDV